MTDRATLMQHSFAFVLDQHLGLRTQALNIMRVVSQDAVISPTWVPVHYNLASGPPLSRFPGLPRSLRGTIAGISEIRHGMTGGQFDGALWATWAAKLVPDLVSSSPAFLVMDMTPAQMAGMGAHYGYSRLRSQVMGAWKRSATEHLYRQAAHLFPWSEWVARSLRDDYGVPQENITVVSPGVDLSVFYPDETEKSHEGVVRLLFVGGDLRRKGGDLLLDWARQTQLKTPWELHIVTRDALPDPPPGVTVHRGLTNNSDELARLYRRCDLFVLPTRADCNSMVAMEAMASGLPVIISDIGGIPEIVLSGTTGMVVPPGDFDMLASQLDRLIADPGLRKCMSVAARVRAIERFDAQQNVGQILNRMRSEARA